jgi:hypothetical protein
MKQNFTVFGLIVGLAVSTSVTFVVCLWEWIENPGGIFHNAEGTNWQFVFDTAVSWALPTFVDAAVTAAVLHLAWHGIVAFRQRSKQDDVSE